MRNIVLIISATLGLAHCAKHPSAPSGSSSQSIPATIPAIAPSPPGRPQLVRLESVTRDAFGRDNEYVPNSWGVQKSRFVRLSDDTLFTAFISEGTHDHRLWHLMRREPNAGWQEIQTGDAGSEPINLVRGAHDEVHVFGWPGTNAKLEDIWSADRGSSFTREHVFDDSWYVDQGYGGATTNPAGDIVVYQGGLDDLDPDAFLWALYAADTGKWTFVQGQQIDYRYTYPFFFLSDNRQLDVVAMRDVHRAVLGYPTAPPDQFDYLLDAINVFHIDRATEPGMITVQVAQQNPQTPDAWGDYDLTYLSDSYLDTSGALHILYSNQYDGAHHAIVRNGAVTKDVHLDISAATKERLIQDDQEHFYIITVDDSGNTLNVYPGSAQDIDGTDLDAPIKLDVSTMPGCNDDDFCHAPTMAVPRNGHVLSSVLDGTYGNHGHEVYFRISLR